MHRQLGDLGGGEGDLSEIWFTTGKSWTHTFVRTRLWKAPAGKQALELELSLLKRRVSGLRWHAMTSTASPPLFVRDFHCSPPPLFVRCSLVVRSGWVTREVEKEALSCYFLIPRPVSPESFSCQQSPGCHISGARIRLARAFDG